MNLQKRQFDLKPLAYTTSTRSIMKATKTTLPLGKVVMTQAHWLEPNEAMSFSYSPSLETELMSKEMFNNMHVRIQAWFVPHTCLERFEGERTKYERSLAGQAEKDGSIIPFFEEKPVSRPIADNMPLLSYMGAHISPDATTYNPVYIEAFNRVYMHRAGVRSSRLVTPDSQGYAPCDRDMYDTSLPRAFRSTHSLSNIVKEYESALMEGRVDISFNESRLPITGLGYRHAITTETLTAANLIETTSDNSGDTRSVDTVPVNLDTQLLVAELDNYVPQIFAEMSAGSASISLADIAQAKETQAFAKLATRIGKIVGADVDKAYLFNLLMDGVTVSDDIMHQPINLFSEEAIIGHGDQYRSTTSATLDEYVTNLQGARNIARKMPKTPVGGVMLITVEVFAEELFERKFDFVLHSSNRSKYPSALRDFQNRFNPEIVTNKEIDVLAYEPDGLLGYRQRNGWWKEQNAVQLGGRFYDEAVGDGFNEDRAQFFQPIIISDDDPSKVVVGFNEHFYLQPEEYPMDIFAYQNLDPVILTADFKAVINTQIQFGEKPVEGSEEYADLIASTQVE
jgi:hypothetical protein